MSKFQDVFLSLGYSDEASLAIAHIAEQFMPDDVEQIENYNQALEGLVDAFNRTGCLSFRMSPGEIRYIMKE